MLSEGLQSPAQSGPWTPLEVLLSHPSPQAPSSHSDLLVCSMNILGALPPQDFCAGYSFNSFPPFICRTCSLLTSFCLCSYVTPSQPSLASYLKLPPAIPPPPHAPYSFFSCCIVLHHTYSHLTFYAFMCFCLSCSIKIYVLKG